MYMYILSVYDIR